MNKSILINSEKLKFNQLKRRLIQENININLIALNSVIQDTHKNNKNILITTLPSSFFIPDHIDHKDFATEFYYTIINILEEKGYIVKLRIEEKVVYIKISWNIQSDADLDCMKKKIKNISF